MGQMIEALVEVGHIEPWNTCHAIKIQVDSGWGYGKLISGVAQEPNGKISFRVATIINRTMDLSFDLAQIDTESIKREALMPLQADVDRAFEVGGKEGIEHLRTIPTVYFHSHLLNGITANNLDPDALASFEKIHPGQTDISRGELEAIAGGSVRHGDSATLWFNDGAHADAFRSALQKAAIACTTE